MGMNGMVVVGILPFGPALSPIQPLNQLAETPLIHVYQRLLLGFR
jgi:hypothetical protein